MSCIEKDKIFRWKNKNVSEAVYLSRKKLSERMKRKWQKVDDEPSENDSSKKKPRLGTRIVNLDILIESLKCKICSKVLSLDDIEHSRKIGGADHFKIKCQHCLFLNDVNT